MSDMNPEDVPEELMLIGRDALVRYLGKLPRTHIGTFEERTRVVLAATLPRYKKMLKEQANGTD